MRWFFLSICVGITTAVELQCDPPLCETLPPDGSWLKFLVEGNTVEMYYEDYFYAQCEQKSFESHGMPHFASEFKISDVRLFDCSLGNASIADALANLNVTLQPVNGETCLKLHNIRFEPHQFSGIEFLTNLTVSSTEIPAGFGTGLPNLRSLLFSNVKIEVAKFQHLPRTLRSFELKQCTFESLSETEREDISEAILTLPNLLELTLDTDLIDLGTIKTNASYQENRSSSLESLTFYSNPRPRIASLKRCNRLIEFHSLWSALEELPNQLVAACPLLESLNFDYSSKLAILPAKLLEGATSLKSLSITHAKIQSLPEGLLQGAPNLSKLDLSYNQLTTLPSGFFQGLPLQSLTLKSNDLKDDIINQLSPLTSLTQLNLGSNSDIENLCVDEISYSPLLNLTQLRILDLSSTGVNYICRDWRENLKFLKLLNLRSSRVWRLQFSDFQYTRDAVVKNAVVQLHEQVRMYFSEDDYNDALTAPETGATINFADEENIMLIGPFHGASLFEMVCYCDEYYWLRKAVDLENHPVKVKGIVCRENKKFTDMTPEELCPAHT